MYAIACSFEDNLDMRAKLHVTRQGVGVRTDERLALVVDVILAVNRREVGEPGELLDGRREGNRLCDKSQGPGVEDEQLHSMQTIVKSERVSLRCEGVSLSILRSDQGNRVAAGRLRA
jgi:hypothetical protein